MNEIKIKNQVKLKVRILREIWGNEDGSYLVYAAEKENGDEITVNCTGFELRPGKTTLVGEMRQYRGQPSFKANYEEFDAESYEGQYNLLCSIDGIKDKTAKNILDNIQNNNIKIFYGNDIPKIKGIGPETIKKIHKGLIFLRENNTLKKLIEICGQSVGNTNIHKINKYLNDNKIDVETFKKDPYFILIDKIGMSFKRVDQLAQQKFNCEKYLRSRCLFLSEQITKTITGFGHTYTTIEDFNKKLQDINLNHENVNKLLKDEDTRVVYFEDDETIQIKNLYKAETETPLMLKNLLENKLLAEYEKNNIKNLIGEYERKEDIKFHEQQKSAIYESIINNVSIICGGAGSGKTTVLKAIQYVLEKFNNKIIFTSPTGKAARRVTEATNNKAYTCHRFYMSEEAHKEFSGEPLEWYSRKQTTMIIDEFSMVDAELIYKILKMMVASKNNFVRIIFVGDPGQLASVGPGSVMADIIKAGFIKVIELTQTFRQSKDSNIIKIANKIRVNETFESIKEKDFFVNCPKDINNYILRCFLHKYNEYKDIDEFYDDFQICTSSRKRANEINEMIQKELKTVKFILNKKEIKFGIGDKVMCVKNDYMNDIYNGEFGRITGISYRTNTMLSYEDDKEINSQNELKKLYDSKVSLREVKFKIYYRGLKKTIKYNLDYEEIENFVLSYCTTIHKLQGSEFKIVVVDVSEFNMITDSRLLYTGITRAKKQLILLSNNIDTINKITRNKLSSKRNTKFVKNLNKCFGGE